jgi:hypothetical protein
MTGMSRSKKRARHRTPQPLSAQRRGVRRVRRVRCGTPTTAALGSRNDEDRARSRHDTPFALTSTLSDDSSPPRALAPASRVDARCLERSLRTRESRRRTRTLRTHLLVRSITLLALWSLSRAFEAGESCRRRAGSRRTMAPTPRPRAWRNDETSRERKLLHAPRALSTPTRKVDSHASSDRGSGKSARRVARHTAARAM